MSRTFLVGGTDAATGQPTRDIWWNDVAAGAWSKVPLEGFTPGKVNAATYSYREGKLWVLDEVAMGVGLSAPLNNALFIVRLSDGVSWTLPGRLAPNGDHL